MAESIGTRESHSLAMNFLEDFSESLDILQENIFYREHEDIVSSRKGTKVKTLTEAGLAAYLLKRQKTHDGKFLQNVELILDYGFYSYNNKQQRIAISRDSSESCISTGMSEDGSSRSSSPYSYLTHSPSPISRELEKIRSPVVNFTRETVDEIRRKIVARLQPGERRAFIIHRDIHTVALIKEGGNPERFLLVDSYDAYGAKVKDKDHLPLLLIIREECPFATIYTLHDKMQSDFYTCRIFAVESAIEIERYCQNHKCGIEQLVKTNSATYYEIDNKRELYKSLRVEAVPVPLPIVPFIQSYKVLDSLVEQNRKSRGGEREDRVFLEEKRVEGETYAQFLKKNEDEVDGKKRNHVIYNMSNSVFRKLAPFFTETLEGDNRTGKKYREKMPYNRKDKGEFTEQRDLVVARTFVSKLNAMRELEQNVPVKT